MNALQNNLSYNFRSRHAGKGTQITIIDNVDMLIDCFILT